MQCTTDPPSLYILGLPTVYRKSRIYGTVIRVPSTVPADDWRCDYRSRLMVGRQPYFAVLWRPYTAVVRVLLIIWNNAACWKLGYWRSLRVLSQLSIYCHWRRWVGDAVLPLLPTSHHVKNIPSSNVVVFPSQWLCLHRRPASFPGKIRETVNYNKSVNQKSQNMWCRNGTSFLFLIFFWMSASYISQTMLLRSSAPLCKWCWWGIWIWHWVYGRGFQLLWWDLRLQCIQVCFSAHI